MALYRYNAYAKDGKKMNGTFDAPSVEAARNMLMAQGIYPFTIEPAQATQKIAWYKRMFARSVGLKEKILFTKQLAVLLKSGIPLLQSLELLVDQFEGSLRTMLITIKDDIKEGKSLADGLNKYPKTFDNIYIQLVRAGEASGKLETILERLVEYLERRATLVKKIKKALSYPIMQLGVVALVVVALLTFVIPTIAENFSAQGAKLPLPTRMIMGASDFLRDHYFIFIGAIISLIVAYRAWKATPAGARMIDTIKLKIPIISFFTRMGAVVQFSRTLGMLLESGVNLAESLDIVVKIMDNRILKDALNQARENIIKQGKITEYLKQTNMFPPIALYLIKTGEDSGQLDAMLLTVAQNYEVELADFSDSLTAKLDPIMLLIMASIVGFVILSIMLPIVGMMQTTEIKNV